MSQNVTFGREIFDKTGCMIGGGTDRVAGIDRVVE